MFDENNLHFGVNKKLLNAVLFIVQFKRNNEEATNSICNNVHL
jgi:hypothetical protein